MHKQLRACKMKKKICSMYVLIYYYGICGEYKKKSSHEIRSDRPTFHASLNRGIFVSKFSPQVLCAMPSCNWMCFLRLWEVVRLLSFRTIGPSDYRVVGLLDLRTIGPSDYLTFGLSGLRTSGPSPFQIRVGSGTCTC